MLCLARRGLVLAFMRTLCSGCLACSCLGTKALWAKQAAVSKKWEWRVEERKRNRNGYNSGNSSSLS